MKRRAERSGLLFFPRLRTAAILNTCNSAALKCVSGKIMYMLAIRLQQEWSGGTVSKCANFSFSLNILSRSRKHSLKFSHCRPDKEYRCFQLEILGVWLLRGVFSGLSLLQHGNEAEPEKVIKARQILPN